MSRTMLIPVFFAALVLYDYGLTLGQEVRLIWTWKSRARGPMALFMLNRCVMLSIAVAYISFMPWVNPPVASEERFIFLIEVATDASLVMWAVVSALRMYAVTQRRWLPTIVSLLLGLAPVATNVTLEARSYFFVSDLEVDQLEHLSTSTVSSVNRMGVVARTCLIVSDALVILVTWYMLHNRKARVARIQKGLSLAQLLIRDVLISRLMLNLRGAVFAPDDPTGYQLGTATLDATGDTLRFQTQLSTSTSRPRSVAASRTESLRTSLSYEPVPSSTAVEGTYMHGSSTDIDAAILENGFVRERDRDDHNVDDEIAEQSRT
ncbi:hypothetical protein WOLCODRAFT_21266 [Wolfiporia cocos MD-104 SS10]|uniref:DUF6533 domain-containing protein n=1 Tax=Wolfiporia cocos (strain MD-104) TaxID=742152 RepID=A0A2H3J9L4_WOLCO|nr:hypothetical protein WOLCODRAFT_21266 [Wolfiporia cocos MD-104 SS10]